MDNQTTAPDGAQDRTPQPDTEAAVAFLRHRPEPWVLSAIDPTKSEPMETRSFDSEREAAVWITSWQGVRNIYFSVNLPKPGQRPTKKMEKREIGVAVALHADVDPADPPAGCADVAAHYEAQRAAIMARIVAHPRRPSLLIDSGNGYQPLWELGEPCEVESVEEIEARNRQLEHELGGDHCHNIDRILRLPGTLNIPDANKRGRGRVVTLARLVWQEEQRYALSDFEPLDADDGPEDRHYEDDDRLRPGEKTRLLPRWLAAIMRDGLSADTKGHYKGDRSKALFAINCALVRVNHSIAKITEINLDRTNKLSEHVYDQGNPPKYARRQAERAFAAVVAEIEAAAGLPEMGSEDMLALTFVDSHKHELRHVAEMSRWYRWDGCKWAPDRTVEVFDMTRRHVRMTMPDRRYQKASVIAAIEKMAKADRHVAMVIEDFDADPFLLNTPDGIVDLRTGELRPSDPLALCSKCTAVTPAPPGTRAPTWEKFLSRIMDEPFEDPTTDPGGRMIPFLQRLGGYMLTGDVSEETFPFAYGTGANGKSKFVNAIRKLMGSYAQTAAIEVFLLDRFQRHPTELAELVGARLVTASEIGLGQKWHASRIKMMTGGEPIRAHFMRQDNFEFDPQFKVLIHGNNKPRLGDVDEAMKRRLILLPFEVTIPEAERDRRLETKLQAEWPAILRWLIDGCQEWQRDGLRPPAKVRAAAEEYLSSEDDIGLWMEERVEKKPDGFVSFGELFGDWSGWAKDRGVDIGLKQTEFKNLLLKRGLVEVRRNMEVKGQRKTMRGLEDLMLRPTEETADRKERDPHDEPIDPHGAPIDPHGAPIDPRTGKSKY